MNKFALTSTAILSVFLLTGCITPNSATQSAMAPDRASGGFLGLSEAEDVSVQTAEAFKGTNQVVIGSFKVGFVESKADKAKAGGGLMGNGFGGKSTAKLKIENLDAATKQQITDAAYSDFVQKLEAQGYKVVERSALVNNEAFAGAKIYDAPVQQDNSGILSDYGMTSYYAPSEFGGKTPVFPGEIIGESGGFAFANPMMGAAKFAEATGIRVLNVSYVMDFANASKHGGSFTSSSSVNVGQGLSVVPGAVLGITGGQGGTFSTAMGSIRTGQPIYSTEEFGTIADTTTDTHKGVEMATNVIGMLGGIGTNISREYVVQADPVRYQTIATQLASNVNNTFVTTMVASR